MSETIIRPNYQEVLVPSPGVLLVVTGASGAGKDTLVNTFLQNKTDFHRIVTYASRPMRPGEQDGVDYNFVSVDRFEEMIAGGELAEYFDYKAEKRLQDPSVPPDYKGTARGDFEQVLKGENVLWRIDPSRAATLEDFFTQNFEESEARSLLGATIPIYIAAPSDEVLLERIRNRAGDEEFARMQDTIKSRLDTDTSVWERNQWAYPNILINDGTVEQGAVLLDAFMSEHIEYRQQQLQIK
ncbi:hypothetical protein KBD81_00585 [Candidatus Woesebacteria bacterium]|nr:hypothetical protein [Candidatus Woesebacteria bacterium]